MLDDILNRRDVRKLLEYISSNEKLYDKKECDSIDYHLFTDVEKIIFLFYDALFKFKIIIDDMSYFDEYLDLLDKLIKKINNFNDITIGVSRIIARLCVDKLNLKDTSSIEVKKKVIEYIYNVYVVNGYYIHGYSSVYYNDISSNGLNPEKYNNFYDNFRKIKEIFNKYNYNAFDKNFDEDYLCLTNSFIDGCYYSVNSPIYFYKLLCKNPYIKEKKDIDCYARNDYKTCYKNLNRLCDKLKVKEYDRRYICYTFNSMWKFLHKEKSMISLILIPRKIVVDSFDDWNKFYDSNLSLNELVNNLINKTDNNIILNKSIEKKYLTFVNLNFYNFVLKNKNLDNVFDKTASIDIDDLTYNNVYGKVSFLLLLGSLFVTLGVIITLCMFWEGF